MTDLEAILQAIDALPDNDLEKVRQRINRRSQHMPVPAQNHDFEDWMTSLHAAIDAFREGLSDNELRDIVNSMNIGYISPKELHDLQMLTDWAEDEA